METCINYCEPGWAYVSSDERRWVSCLRRLAKEHPEECIIMKYPEDNEGFIYGKVPQRWVKISPPRKVNITDERRAELSERLARYHAGKKASGDDCHEQG